MAHRALCPVGEGSLILEAPRVSDSSLHLPCTWPRPRLCRMVKGLLPAALELLLTAQLRSTDAQHPHKLKLCS